MIAPSHATGTNGTVSGRYHIHVRNHPSGPVTPSYHPQYALRIESVSGSPGHTLITSAAANTAGIARFQRIAHDTRAPPSAGSIAPTSSRSNGVPCAAAANVRPSIRLNPASLPRLLIRSSAAIAAAGSRAHMIGLGVSLVSSGMARSVEPAPPWHAVRPGPSVRPTDPTSPPPLRLVAGAAPRALPRRHAASPERSTLDPADARWVFAVRVAGKLEGGRRAILRPENRDRLHKDAKALGLRPFDASLVIAIVQDGARAGHALGPSAADRLALVRQVPQRRAAAPDAALIATATGALLTALVALALHFA